jgi:hypothetical protein
LGVAHHAQRNEGGRCGVNDDAINEMVGVKLSAIGKFEIQSTAKSARL